MNQFEREFENISIRYEKYIANGGPKNHKEKVDYINAQYNSINLILKMIALSASGTALEEQVVTQSQIDRQAALHDNLFGNKKSNIKQTIIEETTSSENDDNESVETDMYDNIDFDNMTTEKLFKEELDAWGINPSSLSYRLVIEMADKASTDMKYKDVVKMLSNITGYKAGVVSAAFSRLVKNADFSKTKYNPLISKKPTEQITKEFIIEQLIEFCE